MNATNDTASKYIGLWNKYGQCIILPAVAAGCQVISYRYWDGGGYVGGWSHVPADQTPEQAATQHPRAGYQSFSWHLEETFTECPKNPAR